MSPYKRNVVTGMVVLLALFILAWMSLKFTGRLTSLFKAPGTPVTFSCERADGLNPGSPITYNGVPCGSVTFVSRSDDNIHIEIRGEVENPPIPENVAGIIRASSALGSAAQIDLAVVGDPIGHMTATSPPIKLVYLGSSMIPAEFTNMAKDARQLKVIEHLDATIVSLKTQVESAGRLMESADKVIGDPKNQENIRASLASIRTITDRATKISEDLETLSKNANTTMADIQKTVAKTDHSVDTLTVQMTTDLDKVGGVLHQVQDMTEKMNHGPGSASLLLNDPKLYDEMAGTAKELHIVADSLSRLVDQWEHEGVAIKLPK